LAARLFSSAASDDDSRMTNGLDLGIEEHLVLTMLS
jgi:hypothetical protein